MMMMMMKGRLDQFLLISSLFYVFATQPRLLSSVQLLCKSSFYVRNVICIFLRGKNPGENVRGNCPRRVAMMMIYSRHYSYVISSLSFSHICCPHKKEQRNCKF